jgi:hypothetical protein
MRSFLLALSAGALLPLAGCDRGGLVPGPASLAAEADLVPLDLPSTGVDVPLGSVDGLAYTLQLTIDGQTFSTIVDTGSATTGLAGAACGGAAAVAVVPLRCRRRALLLVDRRDQRRLLADG